MRPVLIIDFGSQYTQLIARRVRELNVFCEIRPFDDDIDELKARDPIAVILSGGPSSVRSEGAPSIDAQVFEWGVPVLGICYGMQLMCHLLGGDVGAAHEREFGPATLSIHKARGIFGAFDGPQDTPVWMSHGDRVETIPAGFSAVATSPSSPFAAIADEARRLYAVQFHPEVGHTRDGKTMLASFLFDVSGAAADWTPEAFVETAIDSVRRQVGDAHVVCGLSGGVDSSVAATLVSRAVGDRLTCIFVDNGLLRLNEGDGVMSLLGDRLGLNIIRVDAQDEFLDALAGETDPEKKRKTIGKVFIDVFEREAKKHGDASFLVQGTLYPDVIESVAHRGPSATIKSHHNVGGLPERMELDLVEPLRLLFKDEVRQVGRAMEIPEDILGRHPFPGPGLAVRCPGAIDRDKLDVLRRADAIFEEEIRAAGIYDELWQAFAVLVPVKTVGVMGDERTYEWVIALRAVLSDDAMTADWARLPPELLAKVSSRIVGEVRGCNRVVYDITSKPPGTIEWE